MPKQVKQRVFYRNLCKTDHLKSFTEELQLETIELRSSISRLEKSIKHIKEIQRVIAALPISFKRVFPGRDSPYCTFMAVDTIIRERGKDEKEPYAVTGKYAIKGKGAILRNWLGATGAEPLQDVIIAESIYDVKQVRCDLCGCLHPLIRMYERVGTDTPSDTGFWEESFCIICLVYGKIRTIIVRSGAREICNS